MLGVTIASQLYHQGHVVLIRSASILLALLVLACGPVPIVTPNPAAPEGPMIAWLLEHTIGCQEPVDAGEGLRRWTCVADYGQAGGADKTIYRTIFSASNTAVADILATVDQTANVEADIQTAQGFFEETVGGSPPLSSRGLQVIAWVNAHLNTGGATTINGMMMTLTPFGRVTELRLSFPN